MSNNRNNSNRRPQHNNVPVWSVEMLATRGYTITDAGMDAIWTLAQEVLGITEQLDARFGELKDGETPSQARADGLRFLEKRYVGFYYRAWGTLEDCLVAMMDQARKDIRNGMAEYDAKARVNRMTMHVMCDERYFAPRAKKGNKPQPQGKKDGSNAYPAKPAPAPDTTMKAALEAANVVDKDGKKAKVA